MCNRRQKNTPLEAETVQPVCVRRVSVCVFVCQWWSAEGRACFSWYIHALTRTHCGSAFRGEPDTRAPSTPGKRPAPPILKPPPTCSLMYADYLLLQHTAPKPSLTSFLLHKLFLIPSITLCLRRFLILLNSASSLFPHVGPNCTCYIYYKGTQNLQFPPSSVHLFLYVAHCGYWEKVVARLFVEGGEHSSTAELIHNHRAHSGKTETSDSLSSNLFLLLSNPSIAALECYSGEERSTLQHFSSSLGLLLFILSALLDQGFPNK